MSAVELAAIADLAGVPVAGFYAADTPTVIVPRASAFADDRGAA